MANSKLIDELEKFINGSVAKESDYLAKNLRQCLKFHVRKLRTCAMRAGDRVDYFNSMSNIFCLGRRVSRRPASTFCIINGWPVVGRSCCRSRTSTYGRGDAHAYVCAWVTPLKPLRMYSVGATCQTHFETLDTLHFDPVEVARQLTLVDAEHFQAIRVRSLRCL